MLSNKIKLYKVETYVAVILFIVFLFYFIPASNHNIRQHDEFDGNFTSRYLIVNSGAFFETNPGTIIYGTMNGLPRANFVRFTEPVALLMYLFGSLPGYAIAFIIMRLVAFLGIYVLGRDFLKFDNEKKGILILISVCFACLPYNTSYFLSIAGIPIAFWAFLNIKNKQRLRISFITLVLFAVSSNFVLVGFHLCFVFGLIALFYSIKHKKIYWLLFAAIAATGITYILTEYMMFYMHLFNHSYHSSREGFEKLLSLNLKGVLGISFTNIFLGEYNATNYFGYLFMPFMTYYVFIIIKDNHDPVNRLAVLFIVVTIMCALLTTVFDWNKMGFFYETFSFAKIFNLKRFISILPGLFFIILMFTLMSINTKKNKVLHVVTLLTLYLFFILIWRGNISRNRSSFNCTGLTINGDRPNTFNQFFNENMYKQIKKDIGKDSVNNVISFGLLPAPCKYVGLNVLDDYQGDYPLEYKQQFRKVIAREIDKSLQLKELFDGWGSKCYLYSANEIANTLQTKNGFEYEPNLEIDTEQLKKMNCKYILSSILIGNSKDLNLEFQKVYVSALNKQSIILYKLI